VGIDQVESLFDVKASRGDCCLWRTDRRAGSVDTAQYVRMTMDKPAEMRAAVSMKSPSIRALSALNRVEG